MEEVKNVACEVYFPEDIQAFLGLGRSKTYDYLKEVYNNKSPFRVIKIGKLYRVPKLSFDNWINSVSEVG